MIECQRVAVNVFSFSYVPGRPYVLTVDKITLVIEREYDERPAECAADTLVALDHLDGDLRPLAHGEKVIALAAHRGRAGRCAKQRGLINDEPRLRRAVPVEYLLPGHADGHRFVHVLGRQRRPGCLDG